MIITHRHLSKDGIFPFHILEVDALVGQPLSLEIELVVMAGLKFERHAEPGVVGGVADLEVGYGISQMTSYDLLPYGMAV